MPTRSLEVSIYENGGLASGYQAALYVPYFEPDLAETAGSALNLSVEVDSGHGTANLGVVVQAPDRDPLYAASFDVLGGTQHYVGYLHPACFCSVPYNATKLRVWFVMARLRVRWEATDEEDATTQVEIPDRWVGGGGWDWQAAYQWPNWYHAPQQVDRSGWNGHAGSFSGRVGDWLHNAGPALPPWMNPDWPDAGCPPAGYCLHGYTDAVGICRYRFPAAWAYLAPNPDPYSPGDVWTLVKPVEGQESFDLWVSCEGRNPRNPLPVSGQFYAQTAHGANPWTMPVSHVNGLTYRYTQEDLGAAVDYGTWDAINGTLATPSPPVVTHAYTKQGLVAHLREWDESFDVWRGASLVRVEYTVNGHTYSGLTDEDGWCQVDGMPSGSTLAKRLPWLEYGEVEGLEESREARKVPLADASGFGAHKRAKTRPSTYGSDDTWRQVTYDEGQGAWVPADRLGIVSAWCVDVIEASGEAFELGTESEADTLVNASNAYSPNYYDGGEQVALPVTVTLSRGGVTRQVEAYVFEDEYARIDYDWEAPAGAPKAEAKLDWACDPFGEPVSLVAGAAEEVWLWQGRSMEESFRSRPLFAADRAHSLTQAILADHRRLVGYVDDGGAVRLAHSDDEHLWLPEPHAAPVAGEYQGCCLRVGPGGALYLFLTQDRPTFDDPLILYRTSADGGETWSDPVDLPMLSNRDRPDFRWTGSEWAGAVGGPTGIEYWTSPDGVNWAQGETVDAGGTLPVLLPPDGAYHDGRVRCVYRAGEDLAIREFDGSAWSEAVTVKAGGGALDGPAAFGNRQKICVAYFVDPSTVAFRVSLDGGVTWADGASG